MYHHGCAETVPGSFLYQLCDKVVSPSIIYLPIFLGILAVILRFISPVLAIAFVRYIDEARSKLKASGPPDYFQLTGVPPPRPLPNFDIDKAKPRPYRPFRWQYHQTMSLMKMEPDWFIELESTYRERITERKRLYSEFGVTVLTALEGSELACKEIMEMVIQFICVRYPNCFTFEPRRGLFRNHILGIQSNTKTVDPLIFLLENVPEDFFITQRDAKTGLYTLTAGISCSAVGWNMSTKIGKVLHEIHAPIPDYKEKIQFSMDRYFSKLSCNKPIQRGSWGLEIGQPLFSQPGDPHFAPRDIQDPNITLEDIHLRVDWQTLRRLPRSAAIVFNFKALFTPVTQFRTEPFIPRLLTKILKEGRSSLMAYKGTWHVEHKVIPALELWAKEQEERGWVPADWKERTLDEDPFFPSWKEQWLARQQ